LYDEVLFRLFESRVTTSTSEAEHEVPTVWAGQPLFYGPTYRVQD